jgi:hypothetical protein
MSDLPKLRETLISDITKKVVVPAKVPIPPKVDLPQGQPMDASTSFLDDIFLWFRNRLKRMASQEGQGIDGGGIIPSIPKLLNVAGILSQWPLILGVVVILVILFALKVL